MSLKQLARISCLDPACDYRLIRNRDGKQSIEDTHSKETVAYFSQDQNHLILPAKAIPQYAHESLVLALEKILPRIPKSLLQFIFSAGSENRIGNWTQGDYAFGDISVEHSTRQAQAGIIEDQEKIWGCQARKVRPLGDWMIVFHSTKEYCEMKSLASDSCVQITVSPTKYFWFLWHKKRVLFFGVLFALITSLGFSMLAIFRRK